MTDVKIRETENEVVAREWNDINWCQNTRIVRDLRQRIFRASRQGNRRKVRSLQRLMLKCTANQETSIRKVTQINAGRSTPGVDKVVVKTPAERTKLMQEIATYEPYKVKPVRRVFIPKANGKQRPLGIPTIRDRVMQAIIKNALEPEWEAKFEPCSYGFRPGRSCHDAIGRIYGIAMPSHKKKWVVDADIVGFFDQVQHQHILASIKGFPAQQLVKEWLKAGIIEEEQFKPTPTGTPQGGVISPLLANIALHGLERAAGITYRKNGGALTVKGDRALVRYADDFVIFTKTKEDAEKAQEDVATWLQERGLQLSKEKTHIRHLTEGFNFLGFNVRQYPVTTSRTKWKLLIKPSKDAVKDFKYRMKQEWKGLVGKNVEAVVKKLNPILRGWGNYYKTVVSKETFESLDHWMYRKEHRWIKRSHQNKSAKWRKEAYFGQFKNGRKTTWVFGKAEAFMQKLSWIPIKRHSIVNHDASPDDPELVTYWEEREKKKVNQLPIRQKDLARRQKGKCPNCQMSLHNGEELHIHHKRIPRAKGGGNALNNLELIHLYCHLQRHKAAKK